MPRRSCRDRWSIRLLGGVVLVLFGLLTPDAEANPGFSLGLNEIFPRPSPDPTAAIQPANIKAPAAATGSSIVYAPPDILVQPRPLPARLPGDAVAMFKVPLTWEGRDWRRLGLGIVAAGVIV